MFSSIVASKKNEQLSFIFLPRYEPMLLCPQCLFSVFRRRACSEADRAWRKVAQEGAIRILVDLLRHGYDHEKEFVAGTLGNIIHDNAAKPGSIDRVESTSTRDSGPSWASWASPRVP